MAKTYIDTVKYLVYTNIEINGLVEKPDVVGAIFGQTEGLLGDELDLRDLQKNGRIGRIEVDLGTKEGRTVGTIKIPSSLDMVETCIIAASLETVDRVGPCEARIKVAKVEDTRNLKRKVLVDRAKLLLRALLTTEIPESREISDLVRDEVKIAEITHYGRDRLPAGPSIERSNEVILVEGRADVINLLKNGLTNVVALGGAKVQKTVVDLSRKKEVTIFLDGDRGGDIILNELIQGGVDIDFIARAPQGMEVEELTRKEIIKCLRNRMPYEQQAFHQKNKRETYRARRRHTHEREGRRYREEKKVQTRVIREAPMPTRPEAKKEEPKKAEVKKPEPVVGKPLKKSDLINELEGLSNTLRARFYDSELRQISEVPVRDVIKVLGESKDAIAIVFDGIITQRLVDLAHRQGVRHIVGIKIGNVNKTPEGIEIITKK